MDVFWEYARAFLCGGILCLIGQVLIDKTSLTPAKILVIYVVSGVILGGLGLYKYIVEWGGRRGHGPPDRLRLSAGQGRVQGRGGTGALGALTGGVTAAAGGITAAIFFGYLVALIFKPKGKG